VTNIILRGNLFCRVSSAVVKAEVLMRQEGTCFMYTGHQNLWTGAWEWGTSYAENVIKS